VNPSDPFGLIGQVLDGQFRVDKFVGEGGFSIVYRGHHAGLDEPIAIKCLKLPTTLGSALVESFIRRFRDESRIQYRLSQGNLAIARSIGSGTTMSPTTSALVPYMVLEWLEGRSLAQEFEVRRAQGMTGRPLDEVVKLLDSAAQGLAFAHAQGVVHRDVNPGNLFLTSTRQGTMTKVLDFGVAKVVSDHALEMGPRAQTIGQIRIFAPAYGSPEQFDDSVGKVGTASDVYSLALIVLEAMRDRPVREGEHIGEFALMALDPNLRPTPRALGMAAGDAVEGAFSRATALKPGDRPNDVGQFWGSLKHAMREDAGKPAHAGSAPPRAAAWKPHTPAAGQAPADRPVTADMVAPVVEVARPGSIAPPRLDAGVSSIDSRATVRMHSTPPPGDVSSPGAAALSATPGVSKSTVVMGQQTQRILTPVPPTTRTGQAPAQGGLTSTLSMDAVPPRPGPSPLQSQQVPPAQTSTLAMNTGSEKLRAARAQVGELAAASPIPPPAPLPADMLPAPAPSRMDVPTVMPPKPRRTGALVGLAVLLFVIVALAVLGVYRTLAARTASGDAPQVVTTTAAVTPVMTPTGTSSPTPTPTPTSTSTATSTGTPTSTPAAPPTPLVPLPAPGAFDPTAARSSLDVMNGVLASCKRPGGKTGEGPIHVTFAPDGHVQQAVVDEPPFAGSPEAACVASRFKQAHVAPFEGAPGSIVYNFHIPP
jgi:serine/threonine protein kinase